MKVQTLLENLCMFSFRTCPLALGFDNTALKNTTFLLRLLLTPPFTATPGRAEREVPMLRAVGKSDAMHSPQPAQSLSLSSKYTVTFQWARVTRSITSADYVRSSPVPCPFLEQSHMSQLTPGDSLAVRGARTDHSLQVTVSKTTSWVFFHHYQVWKGRFIFAYFTTRKRRAVLWLGSSLMCILRNRET